MTGEAGKGRKVRFREQSKVISQPELDILMDLGNYFESLTGSFTSTRTTMLSTRIRDQEARAVNNNDQLQ